MPILLRGLISGLLLSLLRAPLGLDLLQWPAVEARTAYGWRAAGLVAIALGLWSSRQASLSLRFLLAATTGYGVHALLFANLWSPLSTASLALTAALGLALLSVTRRLGSDEPPIPAPRPPFLQMLGLAAAAAGATLSLEGVARHLRLFGAGLSQDDSVFGLVLLAFLAAGAAAFGWIATSDRLRGLSLPAGLAATAACGFISLRVVNRLTLGRGLQTYLHAYGLDASLQGTLRVDALLAAACFVAPALVAGAALRGARGRESALSVGIGAALGLALVPALLALDPQSGASDMQVFSAELLPLGALVAAAGAALAILCDAERTALARWIGVAASLLLALPALLMQVFPQPILTPWAAAPVFPQLVSDTAEGLVTVEPSRGGLALATLDRRALSPATEGAAADAQRLALAVDLLPPERRARGELAVLLVGQLTPHRAYVLTEAGASRIDRSAAWSGAMERMEAALFEAHTKPAGEILSPSQARLRISDGAYDLVVAPPVPGDAPATSDLDAPAGTVVVRWMEIDQPAEHRSLGRVVVSADGFDHPCLGLLTNAALPAPDDPTRPLVLAGGDPRAAPTPLAWLLARRFERIDERTDRARTAMLARLAAAARGVPEGELAAALEIFYGAQERSSEFETREERAELPDAVLERLRSVALAAPPHAFTRQVWEGVARILTGKRWVEKVYLYVGPVAERYAPWPALEKALARADLESLEPGDAIRRLAPLTTIAPADFDAWYLLGEAQRDAGDGPAAVQSWRKALWLATANFGLRRKVAIELARAGDPDGLEAARQLLLQHPEDHELEELLGASGPRAPGSERPPP